MVPKTLFASLVLLPYASAWGTLGHDTVAFIAQSLISSKTVTFAQTLLNDTSTSYLASVATWADTYRYTAEGAFSAPLHYIDAMDTPPSSCSVDYDRDCPEEGCVVSAIANYTSRVTNTKLSATERQKALKWIVHFVGDIHQPLHDENLEVGGNNINVSFDGTSTNLHHIWDTNMPEKLVGGYSLTDAKNWASELLADIQTGKYKNSSSSWLDGINIKDAVSSSMVWAKDANSKVCTTVLPNGESAVEGKELDGAYYNTAIVVIEEQIAKAGYRLAAWLNLIVTGSTGLSEKGSYGKRFERLVTREEARGIERREVGLESWMVEARRVRRAYGWNCGPEGHRH